MNLKSAHKGYIYQDLFTAYLIAKHLMVDDFEMLVDTKEHDHDCFDDLTIKSGGNKIKFQIKYSESDSLLAVSDFNTLSGILCINSLLDSFKNQKDKSKTTFIVATNKKPPSKLNWLIRQKGQTQENSRVSHLFILNKDFIYPGKTNIKWGLLDGTSCSKGFFAKFTKKFSVELNLPNFSRDLHSPGAFEQEFIEFLKKDVGIGIFPNENIKPEDIAAHLILLAAKARSDKTKKPITKDIVLNSLGLNSEYGHILQQFPFVDSGERIKIKSIQSDLITACKQKGLVILRGLPGSGKSHQFDDLYENLKRDDLVVLKHYCYLEPTDPISQRRILSKTMFGNFSYQLHELYPKLGKKLEGFFAGDRVKVERFIGLLSKEGKRVVLMIDGLDHIERVVNQNQLSPVIAQDIIDEVCNINLTANSCIFISTQPGVHLDRLLRRKPLTLDLPRWDKKTIKGYCDKRGVQKDLKIADKYEKEFLEPLVQLSEGNALYVNYIVGELKNVLLGNKSVDLKSFFSSLPEINNDIGNYYKHLLDSISQGDLDIPRTLALLDFSVTRSELGDIFPKIQLHRTKEILSKLSPILKENISIGGIRIYHESFRRFILESMQGKKSWNKLAYAHIIDWLMKKGFFKFTKSYRYLLSYLQRSGRYPEIYKLIETDFVTQSLYNFYPTKAIKNNLSLVASVAALQSRWDILSRVSELGRSLHTYEHERKDTVQDAYLNAILDVFGAKAFSEKLVIDGKPVFEDYEGLLFCQKCELRGGNPPWNYYGTSDRGIKIENENDKILFERIQSAFYLRNIKRASPDEVLRGFKRIIFSNKRCGFSVKRTIRLAIKQLLHVYGKGVTTKLLMSAGFTKALKTQVYIELAEALYTMGNKEEARKITKQVIVQTKDHHLIHRCLRLGANKIINQELLKDFEHSFRKTSKVILACENLYQDQDKLFSDWYVYAKILSYKKQGVVRGISDSITIDGWFRAWLKFILELSMIESSTKSDRMKENELIRQLEMLLPHTHPFKGKPRACDLYSIRHHSIDSFRRALIIVKSESGLKKTLSALEKISRKTTTTLQGSPGGPLTGEDLSEVLLKSINNKEKTIREAVKKQMLAEFRFSQNSARFYDIQAEHGLNYSRVLAILKETARAKKVFMQACRFLGAYGFHKDITLWEIIDPVKFIAKEDKYFAIHCLEKNYPLTYLVTAHTDGKETRWNLNYWFESLFSIDKKIAIETLIKEIKSGPRRDWRIEWITENYCDDLVGEINPSLLADLYETLYLDDFHGTKFEYRIKLSEILFQRKSTKKAVEYSQNLAYYLYRWRFPTTDKTEYIKTLKSFISLSKKYNFKINTHFLDHFLQKINDKTQSDFIGSASTKDNKKIGQVFRINMSPAQIHSAIETNSYDILSHAKNQRAFFKYIFKLLGQGKKDNASNLTRLYIRGVSYAKFENFEHHIKFFEQNGCKDFAAFLSMLCFANSRGGHGWYALGDSSSHFFAKRAYKLSDIVADKTLGEEIANLLSTSLYTVGTVRHLIEFFSQNGENSISKKIWAEAYEVINYRIPFPHSLDDAKLNIRIKRRSSANLAQLVKQLITAREQIKSEPY